MHQRYRWQWLDEFSKQRKMATLNYRFVAEIWD